MRVARGKDIDFSFGLHPDESAPTGRDLGQPMKGSVAVTAVVEDDMSSAVTLRRFLHAEREDYVGITLRVMQCAWHSATHIDFHSSLR